jgi:hypothetical protein
VFDMFVTRHLRTKWALFTGSEAEFAKIFLGTPLDDGNWDSVIKEWYDALSQPDLVQFRTAYNLDAVQFPQVIVTLEEEPLDQQPLGFDFGRTSTEQRYGMYLRQTAVIRVFAQHAEHVRVLHEFARQIMMLGLNAFARAGFCGLQFESGSDLTPSAEDMPELLGISVRTQRWTTSYSPQVSQSHAAAKTVFVHADDVTIDGNQGGVVVSTC